MTVEARGPRECLGALEMPPSSYRIPHSGARLSAAEKERPIAGLEATFQASPPIEDGSSHGGESGESGEGEG